MSDAMVLDDAACRFGETVAVDGVSMRIPLGALVGLVGPSGSGKTTIVRLLTGALAPTGGSVTTLGGDPRRLRRRTRRRLGYMPQHFSLYPDLTARENVDFVASLFGMLYGARTRRTRQALEAVQLWDARDRRAGRLSGGMQRRLELAAALVHDPDILFLDEPTAGLDPLLRRVIWDELRRLRSEGRTLLVTTQYVGEAEECDVVALLVEGRLVALDTPDGLRAAAAGGDILDVATGSAIDTGLLLRVPGVTGVDRTGPNRARVIVDSAARTLPAVVEALTDSGVEVREAQEYRPTFDEVFAVLVARAKGAAVGIDPDADIAPAPSADPATVLDPGTTAVPVPGQDAGVAAERDPDVPAVREPAAPPPPARAGGPGVPVGPGRAVRPGTAVGPGMDTGPGRAVGPGHDPARETDDETATIADADVTAGTSADRR